MPQSQQQAANGEGDWECDRRTCQAGQRGEDGASRIGEPHRIRLGPVAIQLDGLVRERVACDDRDEHDGAKGRNDPPARRREPATWEQQREEQHRPEEEGLLERRALARPAGGDKSRTPLLRPVPGRRCCRPPTRPSQSS